MTAIPRIARAPVVLPELFGILAAVWATLHELAGEMEHLPWTVVGGQMVYLHALEHDVDPPRFSTDIDVAVDVRSDPQGIAKVVGVLLGLGFTPAGESPEGHLHRFEKHNAAGRAVVDLAVDEELADGSGPPTGTAGSVAVDVLAPEGAGRRANLRTVGRATAFPAKGVTQALHRTQLLPVAHAGSVAWIPRPDLLGAIVLKAVAADVDQADKERHLIDLGFLCGLVSDPFELAELISPKDRQRLSTGRERFADDHPAWNAARYPHDARAALRILAAER